MFRYAGSKVTTKSCTLDIAKTIRNALHGPCEAIFTQETTQAGVHAVQKLFHYVHIGTIAEQLHNTVIGGSYPTAPTNSQGRCLAAGTAAGSLVADAEVSGSREFNSDC